MALYPWTGSILTWAAHITRRGPISVGDLGNLTMRVQVLGSGDAFGSGGRLNTCFMVHPGASSFLIDCGASVMIAIRRFGIDPDQIGAIFLTHLTAGTSARTACKS